MADATKLYNFKYFEWSRPDAPSIELTAPYNIGDTTLYWSAPPLDENGDIIDGGFSVGVSREDGYVINFWIPEGDVAADGLSATNVVVQDLAGTDYDTRNADFDSDLPAGSRVFRVISPVEMQILLNTLQGLIATGGAGFTIGSESGAETVTIYRTTTAGVKLGVFRWFLGTTKAQYSNNGTDWVSIDDTVASVLFKVSAADTTPGYGNVKVVGDGVTTSTTILNPGSDEQLAITANGDLADIIADVTATADEINQALDGISVNVTDTNLNTLTAGSASNADALHTHTASALEFTAYEAITADQAVALLPIEVQYYSQLTGANLALGNANSTRRYAIKVIPSVSGTMTDFRFLAAEAVNGATALGNLVITFETDNAGQPSGTPVTGGTETISQTTQRTWNTTLAARTATWDSTVSFTAGTTYWIVFAVSATDATNYLNLGVNSTYDENYLTFTRLTYNLDTATWGNSTTNATPFFWGNSQSVPFGMALCPTNATYGGRTWSFVGFARDNIAANAAGAVYYDIVPDLSGLTPNSNYYLSTTPGAITTTAPYAVYSNGTPPASFVYRIGKSLPTNILQVAPSLKTVIIQETTAISTTTVRQYILWFQPEFIRINGVGQATANQVDQSYGIVGVDSSDVSVAIEVDNAGTSGPRVSTSKSLHLGDTSNALVGVGTNNGAVGFTYTYTESGTYSGGHIILEAVQ